MCRYREEILTRDEVLALQSKQRISPTVSAKECGDHSPSVIQLWTMGGCGNAEFQRTFLLR
jgi:hypothetical protein